MNAADDREWDLVIRPPSRWVDFHLNDLWRYRDLVLMFVRRDFVAQFKQTLLGPLWFVLQPLLATLVFMVVFGRIAQMGTDGLPQFLFYFSGNLVWMYFSNVLTGSAHTFIANQHLFGKVYFPRLAVPISLCLSHLLKFGLQFGFFILFWIYFALRGAEIQTTAAAWLLPLLVLMLAAQSLGLGILFSALTAKYRDLRFLLDFGVRLLMFATPVMYPLSGIPDQWRWFLLINPVTPVIETFRLGLLGEGSVTVFQFLYSVGFGVASLLLGILVFNRVERNFMDTV